jgi:uncharacterized protein
MYQRLLNISADSPNSYFLFGPRGVGKTTWVKQTFPSATYIDLLNQEIFLDLQAHPYHLSRYFHPDNARWIIIDEIQKIPPLLNEVHRFIEQENRKFILTGSSARSLRRKGVNLLAGRALQLSMHPLTAIEQSDQFNLKDALQFGELPKVKHNDEARAYLKSYIGTYLREEVQQEGLTRNIPAFNRFLEIASFSHGEQLNMSNIAREVGVDSKAINNYFSILEDLLIAYRIPVFSRRAKRRLIQHPKFYYFDVGVYQALRPRGPLDITSEINGPSLEGLLLQELIAINAYLQKDYQFYYWRTASGIEVDFIAYGERGLLAFEVKNKSYVDQSDLSALKSFRKDYEMATCYLVYQGARRQTIDGIHVVPIGELLLGLDEVL